jgi:hypothetical protein
VSRYFINTTSHVEIIDQDGVEVPSRGALRGLLRRVLIELMRDEDEEAGANHYSAHAYDEDGRLVMSAQASLSVTDQ